MMHLITRIGGAVAVVVLATGGVAFAQVGDPTLLTDHPHYAGEGAFQTIEGCVRFATRGLPADASPQQRAIALYNWLLTHQFHLPSPQEPRVAGVTPDVHKAQYDLIVEDANRGRFSYAYGLCGTVHTWNEAYWGALGMRARRRAFPGHVNSEVEYNGAWHAFDTDMAGLLFRRDGAVAGYDDIIKDPTLATNRGPGVVCYPFAWPSDFNSMKKGWEEVAAAGDEKWWKLYHSGYAAAPGIVQMRKGEAFTRYFDRDHFGGASKRRFWHIQEGGPFRNWTFVNMGEPKHDGGQANARGNASYCNAEFIYEPPLDGLKQKAGKPGEPGEAGEPGVVFDHFSPYVIAGDPRDDKDPMTGEASGGFGVALEATGELKMELSVDQGQTWLAIGKVRDLTAMDLTDVAKGRYGWMVRFTPTPGSRDARLERVRFDTVCQVAQPMYPRLTANGSKVTYRAASRGVVAVLPNWALAEKELIDAGVIKAGSRSANMRYTQRGPKQRNAYTTTDNKPGVVVFRVASPKPLAEVRAAARFQVRVPSPPNCDFHLDYSTDDGKTWVRLGEADIPTDNEYSSGWVYGRANVSAANVTEALVRVHLYAGGHRTGLIDADLYGVYRTDSPRGVKVTYAWKERGEHRQHVETIPAGKAEHAFTVPTGAAIEDVFVRMEAR